jgi:hypothetical protein
MKYLPAISFVMILLAGCNNNSPSNKEQLTEQSDVSATGKNGDTDASSCYLFATDRDTVFLKLNPPVDGKVTGDLNYLFYERDGNVGHIVGEIKGDTLFADYTFMSEGLSSVREVAFLLDENQVTEGYGDVKEQDGKMVFWHKDSLDFTNGLVMPKVPCDNRSDHL